MTLNEAQQMAVDSSAALRVVIASPGSGKTRTMVEAIKRADTNLTYQRITVMTFTNAGAHEFRARLGNVRLEHCGTLHSYCFKLIQKFGGFIGYIPGKVAILPDAERIPRLLACRDRLGVKLSEKQLVDPQCLNAGNPPYELVWKEYEFLLKRNNLVDYDGILRVALELLGYMEVRIAVKLDYLFVDEYQDGAHIDQLIYEAIPADNKMYIGDGDQSIFAFRGATPMGFVHLAAAVFDNSITDAEGFTLELNYRSDIRICEVANKLIAHNRERVEKNCLPHSAENGQVRIFEFENVGQELIWLHTAIARNNFPVIAILYRMNSDVAVCRDYLRGMGLQIAGPKYNPRSPDWERALLLLSLAGSPENEILIERYLKLDNDPAIVDRKILEGRATGKQLNDMSMTPWVRETPRFLAENGVSESTINLIKQRVELLAPDADLSDLLHDLYSNEEPKAPDGAGIFVGTIHSAKGKEFDVVFLPAFEQGIIPGNKLDELEENRRVAFVAVTRARHELYISWCSHRKRQWETRTDCQPSQFIAEMGL